MINDEDKSTMFLSFDTIIKNHILKKLFFFELTHLI